MKDAKNFIKELLYYYHSLIFTRDLQKNLNCSTSFHFKNLTSNEITPLSKIQFFERMSNLITLLLTLETFKHDMNDDSFSPEEVK